MKHLIAVIIMINNNTTEHESPALLTSAGGEWILKIYLPVIMVIGTLFNTLSFITVRQRKIKHLPISVYIGYLSLFDSAALLLRGGMLLAFAYGVIDSDICHSTRGPLFILVFFFLEVASWMLVLAASDRFLKVSVFILL